MIIMGGVLLVHSYEYIYEYMLHDDEHVRVVFT